MTKSRAAPLQPLASYWRPVEDVGAPIACLASTYTFHAKLFEEDLIPRFLGLRFDNTERERVFVMEREDQLDAVTAAVFVDAAHVDGRQTTGRWAQVPVRVPRGCQHSKVVVLVWEKMIRVLVSSANLTETGYRRNREVASCLDFHLGEGSASGDLLEEILAFVEHELIGLGQMPPGTRARLTKAISDTRELANGWALPDASTSLPTVTFVPVAPEHDSRTPSSVVTRLVDAWGSRRASGIYVMTPFVGDSAAAVGSTMKELFRIPRTRDAEGHLITGGHLEEEDDSQYHVNLPAWCRDEWANAWKLDADQLSVYVIPLRRDDEQVDRPLHAKAILVTCEERTLLLIGSSNFSPHGLGVGVFNLEANLCFVVREREHLARLEGALPVDWESDGKAKVHWPSEPDVLSDDPPSTSPPPPAAFLWATFDEKTGALSIVVAPHETLPSRWSIWVPGWDRPVFTGDRSGTGIVEGTLTIPLGEAARAHRLTYFLLHWADDKGVQQEARIPTLVDDESELLAPDGLRNLQSDDIVSCLLSGKDPIDWAEGDEQGDEGRKKREARTHDLVRTLDTNSYVIYRTRRFGRALAALSQRLLATLRTRTALSHRLRRDPVGPLMLARAIAAEGEATLSDGRAAALFALGELLLTLSYVALRIDPKGTLNLRPLFDETGQEIDELAKAYHAERPKADPLKRYIDSVRRRCRSNAKEGLNAR